MTPYLKSCCLLATAFIFFACEKNIDLPSQEEILGEYIGQSIIIENRTDMRWDAVQGFYNVWVSDTTLTNPDTVVVYLVDDNIRFDLKSRGGSIWQDDFGLSQTQDNNYIFSASSSNYYSSEGATVIIDVSKKQISLTRFHDTNQNTGEYVYFEGRKKN